MKTYLIKSEGGVMFDYDLKENGEDSLTKMQKAVGGYIEYAPTPFENTKVIVNEEGLLEKLDANVIATAICQRVIVGDVIVQTSNTSVQEYIIKCSGLASFYQN